MSSMLIPKRYFSYVSALYQPSKSVLKNAVHTSNPDNNKEYGIKKSQNRKKLASFMSTTETDLATKVLGKVTNPDTSQLPKSSSTSTTRPNNTNSNSHGANSQPHIHKKTVNTHPPVNSRHTANSIVQNKKPHKAAYTQINRIKQIKGNATNMPTLHNTKKILLNVAGGKLTQIQPPTNGKVEALAHNLDRVLFSPGVHYLQDPRTRVYNFSPYLQKIMQVSEFDFDSINQYITSSKDKVLLGIAEKFGKKYYSSTSSMTSTLSQFHFLISNGRPLNAISLSKHFTRDNMDFSFGAKLAATVLVQPKGKDEKGNVIYSIDSDKSADKETVLSMMGHSMEKLLTTNEINFENHRKGKSHVLTKEQIKKPESYNYAVYDNFLMRSQLDCVDPRLPGNGTFDLKTRAVCAVRHDIEQVEENATNYQIYKSNGEYESFEREDFELMKAAFLKYSLQARIGQMDGIFVAYHNIQQLFGFRYFPLTEIDKIIHSYKGKAAQWKNEMNIKEITMENLNNIDNIPSHIADQEFKFSLKLWDLLLNKIIERVPNQVFRLVMKHEKVGKKSMMNFIAVPLTDLEATELNSITVTKENTIDVKSDLLRKQQIEFDKFIEKTESKVFGYNLCVDNFLGGLKVRALESYMYPSSTETKWDIQAHISELEADYCQKKYREYLGERSQMIAEKRNSNEYVLKLRRFSDVGEERLKNWEENTPKQTIYEPKFFNDVRDGKVIRDEL